MSNEKKSKDSFFAKIRRSPLFLPIVALILVMAVNIIHDAAVGSNPLGFFVIKLQNTTSNGTILYGRIIDILNRGSEAAILALGMTLVVSSSAGTDISVGSVMSLSASFCCMLLAGYGVSSTTELAVPLFVGILGGLLMGCVCGCFNGFLVAYLHIQPMVATLIMFTAGRSIAGWINNSALPIIKEPEFGYFGNNIPGIPIPSPIFIAMICVIIIMLVLKFHLLNSRER
jgi:simple sugar transport system permease protein